MTRQEIMRMAREAGFTNPERFETDDENLRGILEDFWVNLERFAALVASAEREACAEVCEAAGPGAGPVYCAFAIRARGQE
jgi:hypothetical protein